MSDEEMKEINERLKTCEEVLALLGVTPDDSVSITDIRLTPKEELAEITYLTDIAIKKLTKVIYDEMDNNFLLDMFATRVLKLKELMDLKRELKKWNLARETLEGEFKTIGESF